uniref:ABC transporter domain-containing protein n=1 Tax=Panagrolaimus sp. ES5 TaxID=591445 RepID=A0AC34GEJ4_9BILA
MRSHKHDISFGACLEIQELSFIRSFVKGNWVSSIYTPPVTAEFLRRISLKIVHGEVHGIIGAAGSGKSTLLKVVSNQIEGKLDGKVLLNGQPLTRKIFSSLCEYVDFKTQLLPSLSVEQILHYHARLALNCKADTVNYRVFTLMQQFDLGPIADRTLASLREADRRRLLIAMHLVKDPVLIIIDDPIKGLDALSAFQLMSSLQDYTKRQARMALVTMRCPRSDIYQLLTQITLLFYGEIIYSGPTKQMP